MELSLEEKKIIDRINRSYDDNTQYVEASVKDWNYIVHSIRKLHEEIEEKSTIIMAGAEKVKQLEKEIEELKEKNAQLTNYLNDSYYVSADEIREKIDELKKQDELSELSHNYLIIEVLQELLEEN